MYRDIHIYIYIHIIHTHVIYIRRSTYPLRFKTPPVQIHLANLGFGKKWLYLEFK